MSELRLAAAAFGAGGPGGATRAGASASGRPGAPESTRVNRTPADREQFGRAARSVVPGLLDEVAPRSERPVACLRRTRGVDPKWPGPSLNRKLLWTCGSTLRLAGREPREELILDGVSRGAVLADRRDAPLNRRSMISFPPRLGLVPMVAAVGLIAAGCARQSPPPLTRPAPGGSSSTEAPAAEVGLRPGDAVKVQIWREPDLSGDFTVNQEGIVVFPLLGERDVTGVSGPQLEERLEAEYREYLVNPSIDVTVLRRISILGEVRNPGLYPVDATFTLTDALALAGGVSPTGDENDIRLIRDGRIVRQTLDETVMIGSAQIQSGDQIVVGQRSWLSRNIGLVSAGIGAMATILTAIIIR